MSKSFDVFFCPRASSDTPSADCLPDSYFFHGQFAGSITAGESVVERITREIGLPVRTGRSVTGTGFHTGNTFPAHGGVYGLTGGNIGIGQYRGDSDGGTELPGNQQGALAYPAESGAGGDRLMREGSGEGSRIMVVGGAETLSATPISFQEFHY